MVVQEASAASRGCTKVLGIESLIYGDEVHMGLVWIEWVGGACCDPGKLL